MANFGDASGETTLSRGKLFKLDQLYLTVIFFVALLFSPVPNAAFTIGGNLIIEIPTVIFIVLVPFLGTAPSGELVVKTAQIVVAASVVLFPFCLVGLSRGAPLEDVYADTRAMIMLVGTTAILFQFPDRLALRIVTLSCLSCLISFALIYALGVDAAFIPEAASLSGKVTLPWLAFITVCLIFSCRGSWLWLPCLLLATYVGIHTSYRYVFIILAMTFLSCTLIPFLKAKSVPVIVKVVALTAIALSVLAASQITRSQVIAWLMELEVYARNAGLPEYYAHQLFDKNIQNLQLGLIGGDYVYIQYSRSFFDVLRFGLPHGIGHKSSLGDPAIFGGNTIDSSLIFVDYHFSVWVTFLLIGIGIYTYIRLSRGDDWLQHIRNSLVLIPLLSMLYIRASCFVDPLSALSLAFALRFCNLAVGQQKFPRRTVPKFYQTLSLSRSGGDIYAGRNSHQQRKT